MYTDKHRFFRYINLFLKIYISIVILIQSTGFLLAGIFLNFFEPVGMYLGIVNLDVPAGILSITIFTSFFLWFLIIICEITDKYVKFRYFYTINFIAELYLAYIFLNQIIFSETPFYWLSFLIMNIITFIMGIVYYFLKLA